MHFVKTIYHNVLKLILTLPSYSAGSGFLISFGIIDSQNNGVFEYSNVDFSNITNLVVH